MLLDHPGHWQQFQLRPDNRGLSIMEMKSKYLHEQFLFEAQAMSQMQEQQSWLNGASGFSVPESTPTPAPFTTEVVLTFNSSNWVTIADNLSIGALDNVSTWNVEIFNTVSSGIGQFQEVVLDDDANTATLRGYVENDTSILPNIFIDNTDITSIVDNNENCIIELGNECFRNSTITSVSLNALTTIGTEAFYSCDILDEVLFGSLETIPDSTNGTGGGVFNSCPLLTTDFEKGLPRIVDIGEYAFYDIRTSDIIFPDTLTSLRYKAFTTARMSSVTFNASVNFEDSVFDGCTALDTIDMQYDCTFAGSNLFQGVAGNGNATVVTADYSNSNIQYLEDTLGWTINVI
jgi:hypothetical protein